nr:hypothetical protein [Tanacetum cinerariifolium]
TYTSVYTAFEPWRYYREDSAETVSPGVIVYGYDGLHMQPIAPPSPDYDPEYLAPSDDEAPLEDQLLPADASPTAASPGYVADSNPNEDLEEDLDDDHADYPADGGDGDDEPSDDDDDDDTNDEDEKLFDEEEEEEHLASADSSAIPIVDPFLLAGDIEALEAEEPTPTHGSPHIIILLSQTRLPSPPLPFPLPLTTSPTDTGAPLGYRATEIRMRALLPSTSRRTDIPEADVPPRKRAFLTTLALGFEVRESFTAGAAKPGPTESDLRRYRVEQDDRAFLRARVNTLFRDRPDHHPITMLLDIEVMYAREAWAGSEDRSSAIAAHVRTLEILEARDLEPQEGPAEAGSSCVAAALAEHDANMSRNGNNITDSGTGERRQMTTPLECTYNDFLKCQLMSFQGTKGVVGLTQWLEKMESVFQINNCTVACQVKFASYILQGSGFTWWNSHMRAVGHDVAYAMPWAALKRMITDKYCPRAEHKRKFDDTSRNNQHQHQPFKRNNMARAYTAGPGDKKPYGGTKPLCPKCNYHHDRPCAPKCTNCKKISHLARDCKGRPAATNNNNTTTNNNNTNNNNQRAQGANARGITCFECGVKGHYKSDCPKLKNGNQGNQAGNGNAMARAYAVGTAETNPNSNII